MSNWASTSFETLDDRTLYLLFLAAKERSNLAAMNQMTPIMKSRLGITTRIPEQALIGAFRRHVFSQPVNIPQEPEIVRKESLGQAVVDIEQIYKDFFDAPEDEDLFTI